MDCLKAPIRELGEYEEIAKRLKPESSILLSGCMDSQRMHMIYGLSEGFKNRLIITYNDLRMKEIYEDYKFYDKKALMFPAKDLIFYQADIHSTELTESRMKVLKKIVAGEPVTIITTFDSLQTPLLPLSLFRENIITIAIEDSVDEREIAKKLVTMGYQKNYQVEAPGQFAIRGGIIDIFDLTEENPYRIELWGDEVTSIRSFDLLSQRSIERFEKLTVYPATEMLLDEELLKKGLTKIDKESKEIAEKLRAEFKTEEAAHLRHMVEDLKEQTIAFSNTMNLEGYIHYFYEKTDSFIDAFDSSETILFLDEPGRIKEHIDAIELEFRESMLHRAEKGYVLPGQMEILEPGEVTMTKVLKKTVVSLSGLDMKTSLLKWDAQFDITARSVSSYNNSFEALVGDLKKYKKQGYRVLLLSGSRTRAERLAEDLRDNELTAFYTEDPDRIIQAGEIMTFYGHVTKGFEYPMLKFVVLSETDIFGAERKKKKKKKYYDGQKINDFAELSIGDYVVHESHGLGIYKGIEKVESQGTVKDYMKIEYKDGGNLYIPATGLDVIQKYASADAAKKPKLNKLGTVEWEKTKGKVKEAVGEVAKDLVELYATRQKKAGFQFSEDNVWQREFEEMFPFEETEDQLTAIEATKKDMESKKIMDRLVCGDVGYGKTEIAIRAAFKAVQDGKQVVLLVPTTILAQQHYNTFVQRMKDYPVKIDMLSRFRSAAQQKKTLTELSKGFVDILIGTHRVLSKDVVFKDLGLLIVDEEQRFGVAHKEKIKKLKDDVDVLTLSATPIPRTLHMSLVGIRDMSVLEEAPNERMPIQTYVLEYNEEMVREAITRELSRNGQIYYVYNRVNNIADVAARIQALVPEANVAFAHGQMKETELENIMMDFISGEIDVLVATTIIETGLDISNVNTIIIHDSDNMGLSQLYQLRGRVGRSNRNAYAFLMYKRDKMLKEVAEKRLQAIREFTDLGSGFKIAMRDLEIRGAGNILGVSQHGHMAAVGYDLYCKMLNEAVKNLKGIEEVPDFITSIDLDVDAFIPQEFIMNEAQKLDIYKRIAGIENKQEANDMKEELMDRFGALPRSVQNLLRIALIRSTAHRVFITDIVGKNEKIVISMYPQARIKPEMIPEFLRGYGNEMSFSMKGTPTFEYRYKKTGLVEKDAELLLKSVEDILQQMLFVLL